MKIVMLNQPIDEKDEIVKLCLDFLFRNGGKEIALGKHDVSDGIFVNVSEYMTRLPEQGKWEAHIEYVDFQLLLEGEEYIYVSDINKMETSEYDPDRDYIQCFGETEETLVLDENTGVILMPEDAHKPCMSIDNTPMNVKKVVFKIPIRYFFTKK